MKPLFVDITAADAPHSRLGRYRVSEQRPDGSLVLVPETVVSAQQPPCAS